MGYSNTIKILFNKISFIIYSSFVATFMKFHYIYVSSSVFLFDVVFVSDIEKLRQLLHRYVHFEFAIFKSTRKDLNLVEFAAKRRLKYELKAKHARRLSSRVLGKRITCAVTHCTSYSGNMVQPLTQKNSWFFNMAANKADLTTNFNGNVWHFLITKSSFCLGKTFAKRIKIRYLFKF